MTLMALYSESLHIIWTINVVGDGPLTVQTFLSLPNGQMHLVIFTSNSYNDEGARGSGWSVGGEGYSSYDSSVCLLLSSRNYI